MIIKGDAVVEEQEQQQCAVCLNEFEDFDNDATLLNCGCQQLLSQCLYLGVAVGEEIFYLSHLSF